MRTTNCFVQKSTLTCIDDAHPVTGRSTCYGHTLAEVQERYPGAEVMTITDWLAWKEEQLSTKPVEITEERFMEMLEVLPPQNWQRANGSESFEMSEHLSGRITDSFVRIGGRYFSYTGIAGQPHSEKVYKCGELLAA